MELIPYTPGLDYGVGIESLGGNQRGDAVVRPDPQAVVLAGGQEITFILEMVDSLESLQTSLDVSMKASGSYFMVASGSAKAQFVERCNYQEYSIFMMVNVTVQNAFRQMRDVVLKPTAIELLKSGKVDRFREQYGDQFVNGVRTGGELFGILQVDTKDESDYQQVSAKIKGGANLGVVNFSASVAFSKTVAEVSNTHSTHLEIFKQGGDSTIPLNVDELLAHAQAFPGSVAGDLAVPYQASVMDYRSLDMPDLPNWIDLQNAREVMDDIFAARNLLMARRNSIDYILSHAQQFMPFNEPKLNEARNVINKQINDMTQSASRCVNNLMTCKFPEIVIPEAAATLPKRKGSTRTPPKLVLTEESVQNILKAIQKQAQINKLATSNKAILAAIGKAAVLKPELVIPKIPPK